MNGNDLFEYEQKHFDALLGAYCKKNSISLTEKNWDELAEAIPERENWCDFVLTQMADWDARFDMMRDD